MAQSDENEPSWLREELARAKARSALLPRNGRPIVTNPAPSEHVSSSPGLRERAEAHGCDVEDENTGRLLACRDCTSSPGTST